MNGLTVLSKHFKFDHVFNLLDYGTSLEGLINDLLKFKKDSYEPNYRFIFLHYDTDYYPLQSSNVGLVLLNLQKILAKLDIPNYFCLILSQQDIASQLEILKNELTNDQCSIGLIIYNNHDFSVGLSNTLDSASDVNSQNISLKFISLNRVKRFHRHLLVALLKDKGLLDQGLVSYGNQQ